MTSEFDQNGKQIREYIYLNNMPVAMVAGIGSYQNAQSYVNAVTGSDEIKLHSPKANSFQYLLMNGDGEISAKLQSCSDFIGTERIGLSAAESENEGSPYISVFLERKNSLLMRTNIIKTEDQKNVPIMSFNRKKGDPKTIVEIRNHNGDVEYYEFEDTGPYFKLARSGDDISIFASSNNSSWVKLGEYYLPMDNTILAGIEGTNVDSNSTLNYTIKADDLFYIIPDHLGAPYKLINNQSATVGWEKRNFEIGASPYGDNRLFDGTSLYVGYVQQPLRFPGQYADKETGLYYNWHRYYDPRTGRYVQSDPIGLNGGLNTYAYVGGNPLSYVDPLGLYTEIIIWQPVGKGGSSFGHVSSNVNSTNYSWGHGGWDTLFPKASDYISRQKEFRSGTGVVLNLTPEQENRLVACYARPRDEYSAMNNNCADPHQECLSEVLGYTFLDALFPVDFGERLMDSPYYMGSQFYEGPKRNPWPWPIGDDALWTRPWDN
ncbi:RHS repeat-associated core domain-containing protein [Gynuella sunshinyii]|uniref:Rhs family protein n=1 Tax=Gynuella sunshinyii YC6258 TaxID=1445510 RepID=A0A0C5VFL3_9GAMM|nr:RHS repeat-associated core domain-containing protein [Gynuella sunshinyii]AJQ93347.1 rhs family protein [Gynuella sunshinyii YC6258]